MAGGTGRTWWAACVMGAMLVPTLTACTSGAESERAAPGSVQSVSTVRRAQLESGGTARWAVDALPATLNAYQFEADAVTDRVAGAVLPSLFTLDAEGRPQLNTDYLRSAEITEREPRQRVVYTLNPKARWSDGTPVGADDFLAQWKALNGEDKDYWSARNVGYDRIGKVRKGPEAHQVEVTFTRPYADWKSLFTPLYPRAVTGDPDVFNDGARTELPVSGGPFEVADVDGEAGTVTLARNDAWWGDAALLDELVLAAVPRGERRAALAAGDLDIAEVSPQDADRITAARHEPAARHTAAAPAPDADGAAGDPADSGAADPGAADDGKRRTEAVPSAAEALDDLARARLAGDEVEVAAEQYRAAHAAAQHARERQYATREEADREAMGDLVVHRAYDASWTQLTLNGTSPALADERVRWAVARAIDRDALAEAVHAPADLPVRPLGNHLRTLGQAGYQDNSAALGDAGAESASALLDEAGWREGGPTADAKPGTAAAAPLNAAGPAAAQSAALLRQSAAARRAAGDEQAAAETERRADDAERRAASLARSAAEAAAVPPRAKDGTPLELRLVLPDGAEAEPLRATARRVAAMLATVGIRAVTEEVDAARFFEGHVATGDFDLALFSWPATAYPATDARPLFAKPRTLPGGTLRVEQNYARVGTDYVDQLLDQAAGELDEKEYDALLDRADARIWAAAGSVPLYQRPQLVAVRDTLAGVGAFGLETPRYQDIGHRR
ncbi:ABC transporter family substrate-binding protein [Streptomyces avicenniae]|uniref:ABC transporter family substrate-binding protein n=1 Tax=Streptomyces avicenniae TaxID=500153 RepID=UPI00069CA9D4|nr:ABC transporter family substrate-binding protein [Streptomyces avicenniae]